MPHPDDLKKCLQSKHRPAFITPPVPLPPTQHYNCTYTGERKERPLEWQQYRQRIEQQSVIAKDCYKEAHDGYLGNKVNHQEELTHWLPTENARELEALRSDVNHNARLQDELARVVVALGKPMDKVYPGWRTSLRQENDALNVPQRVVSSTFKQDENDAVAALTKRMDRLCSEMDSVRQENVQLHARIAQLEKHAPSTVEVEEAAIETEAQRRIKEMKDEEIARELAELWSSSGDVEQHQRERAAKAAEARCAAARKRGVGRRV